MLHLRTTRLSIILLSLFLSIFGLYGACVSFSMYTYGNGHLRGVFPSSFLSLFAGVSGLFRYLTVPKYLYLLLCFTLMIIVFASVALYENYDAYQMPILGCMSVEYESDDPRDWEYHFYPSDKDYDNDDNYELARHCASGQHTCSCVSESSCETYYDVPNCLYFATVAAFTYPAYVCTISTLVLSVLIFILSAWALYLNSLDDQEESVVIPASILEEGIELLPIDH